jgi:hypothetical protein
LPQRSVCRAHARTYSRQSMPPRSPGRAPARRGESVQLGPPKVIAHRDAAIDTCGARRDRPDAGDPQRRPVPYRRTMRAWRPGSGDRRASEASFDGVRPRVHGRHGEPGPRGACLRRRQITPLRGHTGRDRTPALRA